MRTSARQDCRISAHRITFKLLHDAHCEGPVCVHELTFGAGGSDRLLWVASRRWAATDGFHRLDGGKQPDPDIGGQTETLKFTTAAPQIAEV